MNRPDDTRPDSTNPSDEPGGAGPTEGDSQSEPFTKVCPQCGRMYGSELKFCPADGAGLRLLASSSDLIGQIIADRFCVLSKLGEGGMGEVYLAEHVQLGRQCAVKVMRRSLLHDADAAARFRREAMNASVISHPNVATIFDFVESSDGLSYLVMEFVDGESLSALLAREGALPPARAADICRQISDALGAAHDLGIVHRDLKPDNVVLASARGGRDLVKVVDFGIAKAIESAQQQVTRTGLRIGTPAFMSPEQLRGDPLDGRSDLYSLGCILYEMLTGQRATPGDTDEVVIARRFTDPPPRPSEVNSSIPAAFDQIVVRLMNRWPDERYASAAELSAALDEALRDTPGWTPATAPPTYAPQRTQDRSSRTAAAAAATVPSAASTDQRSRRWSLAHLSLAGAAVVLLAAGAWFGLRDGEQGAGDQPGVASVGVSDVPEDEPGPGAGQPPTSPDASRDSEQSLSLAAAGDSVLPDTARPPATTGRTASAPDQPPARVAEAQARASEARDSAVAAGASAAELSAGDASLRTAASSVVDGRNVAAVEQYGQAAAGFAEARRVAGARRESAPTAVDPGAGGRPGQTSDPRAATDSPAAPARAQEAPGEAGDAAELRRAEENAVRSVIVEYVQALNARDVATLRRIFPGLPDGTQRSMSEATDWSATLTVQPTVSVTGATAEAEFGYELDLFLPRAGRQQQSVSLRASLRRVANQWQIATLTTAR